MDVEFQPKMYPTMLLDKDWTQRRCFVRSHESEFFRRVHELEVRDDDVWLVTLPKCGTTWMQELLWLVLNDYDFERAKREPLELRSPFVEFGLMLKLSGEEAFKPVNDAPSPRLIKTHLPLPLLPYQVWTKKPKLVYMFRNPKDAFVSAYYFRQNFGYDLDTPIAEAVQQDLNTDLQRTTFWQHVLEFYELRHEPWIHFTSFERLKLNLRKEIEEVCTFMGRHINEEQMQQMLKHLSFEEMKSNPQCNHLYEIEKIRQIRQVKCLNNRFMRAGKVNGHKEELPPALIAQFDHWIENNLKPHNLTLDELLVLPQNSRVPD